MEQPIIFFDGLCPLCNGAVRFVIRHEKVPVYRFVSLQADVAGQILASYPKQLVNADTILLLDGEQLYIRSEAVFRIAEKLKAPWSWVRVFKILPGQFSDFIYKLIARSRYRIFGKYKACPLPDPALADRFVY